MKKTRLLAMTLTLCLLNASAAFALTDGELETAARAYVPANFSLVKAERRDSELTFRDGRESYEVEIDPETGVVLKVEYENDALKGSSSATLSDEEAVASLQTLFPDATVVSQNPELDDRLNEIKLFFYTPSLFGTMSLNGETGDVLDYDVSIGVCPSEDPLTQEAAQARLMTMKPGSAVTKLELDKEEGRVFWEGEATLDGKRYEFCIDAFTGELTEWERE